MYTNSYELAAWGDGHRELIAQDVRNARYAQSRMMQRLVRVLNRLGSQLEVAGQRLTNVQAGAEPQLTHW